MKLSWIIGCILLCIAGCKGTEEPNNVPDHVLMMENITVYSEDDITTADSLFIEKDMVFSDTDDVLIGGIPGVLVDINGRVFILDGDQEKIHAFEADGSYLASIGGEGEGPGEFRMISRESQIDSNNLYIYDINLLRISVFSSETLTLQRIIEMNRDQWIGIEKNTNSYMDHYFVGRDKKLIIGISDGQRIDNADEKRFSRYYRADMEGNIISEMILELQIEKHLARDTSWGFTFPFFRTSMLTVSNTGHFYTAWTDEILVKIYSTDGEYLRSFYIPFKNASLNRKDVINRYDQGYPNPYLNFARNMQLPETWPAINSMQFDDQNRLWISTIIDDQEVYQWWVLEDSGELVGRFIWPRNKRIETIKNNHIYTLEIDGSGAQKVIRYRYEFIK
ncbi:MAG: 6-bladed beta-propeller [Candidatus Halalkalibacterium sp. M3_1C_030]